NILIVCQKLLRVLWQTIPTVPERRIVIMISNTRIQPHTLNNLSSIKTMRNGITVQLVKIGNPHREVSIGKELDSFGFCTIGKQNRNVLTNSSRCHQIRKDLRSLGAFTYNYSRRLKVVVEGLPLAQKLGREHYVIDIEPCAHGPCIADRDG